MCSLWQRFGRGARAADQEAVAIFLVESKHFDEEREKAEKRREQAKQRKQNKTTPATASTSAQLPPAVISLSATVQSNADDMEDDPSEDEGRDQEASLSHVRGAESDNARRARYQQAATLSKAGKSKKRKADALLEDPIDDLINADTRPGLQCRRKPVTLYFNTGPVGECCDLPILY